MITAERSDPPRPRVTSRWPFVARKPGTTITEDRVRDASSVSAWRSTRSGCAISPVSCAFSPTAGVPAARSSSVSRATDRTSPVDHSRSSSSCPGSVAYRRASSSSASVWPFSAETTTTRRLPPAASRATNAAAWRYPAGPVSTDPPIFSTADTRSPFRPHTVLKKACRRHEWQAHRGRRGCRRTVTVGTRSAVELVQPTCVIYPGIGQELAPGRLPPGCCGVVGPDPSTTRDKVCGTRRLVRT